MKEIIRKFAPDFLLNFYHFLLALGSAVFYKFPSRQLKVIGVTGTNGKSTTVEMIAEIFKTAGFKTASLSSIRFQINDFEEQNKFKMTMPGRFFVQQFLRRAVDAGCKFAVIEVTSEGIKQHRHRFIDFGVVVLTNLTPEHIEAHKGFENYKIAKGKLFEAVKNIHIVNLDDENAEYFLQFPAKRKFGYSADFSNLGFRTSDIVKATDINSAKKTSFRIKNTVFNLNLRGEFNVYNALAAVCVGLSQKIDLDVCRQALEKITGIPGRMELVVQKPFKVFVDYAFTPNALEKVYQSLIHENKKRGQKLICVLGACGGGRDKWKRKVLGSIAAKYCDRVIITNEDPYEEDPMEIIEQVAEGTGLKAKKILDRREAIEHALGLAKRNSTVIITGKGSEPWMCVAGNQKIPWDDREIVKEEFRKLIPVSKKEKRKPVRKIKKS